MNTVLLSKVENKFLKKNVPPFETGDTIAVKTIIREKDRKRYQTFKGVVIAMKGSGTSKTFTIRKISYGVGVEKIFPIHSPNIDSIELLKKGDVRRSKIYYLRGRIGKQATKVKAGEMTKELLAEIEELKNLGVVTESNEPEEAVAAETGEQNAEAEQPTTTETTEEKKEEKPQDK